ncbi:hypothetical protein BDR05DRAFT_620547 [Suillus weaverae]|nr:hypothetical protein BDR05DRAFT_620547 [Suillus weaverae]
MNALVVQWYDSKSLEIDDTDGKKKDVTVEMIYLYFLGVVYELAHDKIDQDLRQKLSKNIPNITLSSLPSKITPTQFRTYVETYNRSKFKADYGIDFPIAGTAGSKKEKHWSVFFEFPSWGPSDDAIKEAVGRKLFEYILIIPLLHSTKSKFDSDFS